MDAVNAFNLELFSMIDMKPPISRAKMMSVTKSAIKAIKLYKHVVQIVEKFIKKCKPDLKVPGLYVVDSIIRQSRHQFGIDKDVFAPRFLKNFNDTFQNLYLCPEDDKTKIVRVLNLWQKNGVFGMDIIQPLLDRATASPEPVAHAAPQAQPQPHVNSASVAATVPQLPNSDALAAVAQLFQSSQGQELQKMLQNLQHGDGAQALMMAANAMPASLQIPQTQPHPYDTQATDQKNSLAKKLLDRFDYDDEPEDAKRNDINDPSLSPRRRRSGSGTRSQRSRPRGGRSRSRSRERRWASPHSRSQEQNEREKDRERRQKGLPSIKSQTLSVCSTTLWVGQLDKKTQQSDVMSLLEEFGQIESINMIPPRGCAYIAMVHRQDAYTALNKLSRGSIKVSQKPIKIAWALNKGIKAAFKKFWEVERGVSYIPWNKVKVEDLESFREGGMLDMETLNPEWGSAVKELSTPVANGALEGNKMDGSAAAHVQVAPAHQAGSIGGHPGFPGPPVLSPTSMPPGGPPRPFMPAGFDPTKMSPGFLAAAVGAEESSRDHGAGSGASSDTGSDNQLASPGPPMMSPPGPGGMQGLQPGMLPLGMPPPHMSPFLPPPNMMPPHMMPGGPMFSPGRFRMPMPRHPMGEFPPRGPPFGPGHPFGPEEMEEMDGRHFRNERPGFGPPPFPRGGGNGWPRDGPEGRGHFMNRRDRY
ncbi:SR-related and CTD-associated factor 4-like [Aplochiton taeniatus]